jgi:excisionase family DNA binding protein
MTVKEAAEKLGMRYDALIRRIQRGYVHAEKLGERMYIIHRNEIKKIKPRGR